MKQSKDPFEVAFEEQEESPPESPVKPEDNDDTQAQTLGAHQISLNNAQGDDDDYDDYDNNDNDDDVNNVSNHRAVELKKVGASSSGPSTSTAAVGVRGKSSKEDEEEELEEDNMDVELGKFTPAGDPDKMAKMQ